MFKVIVIKAGNKRSPVIMKHWRYYSVVDNLLWSGFSREDAESIAKWAQRAGVGEEKTLNGMSIKIEERPDNTLSNM